jgi:hypothetical protein
MAWTPDEETVAKFMLAEYRASNWLTQKSAVLRIRGKFGDVHLHRNKLRHWAINAGVLEAFRSLTPNDTVWSRGRQLWRPRTAHDPPDSRIVR